VVPFPVAASDIVGALDAVVWPALIGGFLLVLLVSTQAREAFGGLTRRVTQVKALGVEVALDSDKAAEAKASLEEIFSAYRARITTEFSRQRIVHDLDARCRAVVEHVVVPYLDARGMREANFRCTVHVPDVLFIDRLYQLLDYYPNPGSGGGGAGRTFDIRFGIVGRTWRLEEPQVKSSLDANLAELIDEWGMTQEEARAAGQGRKSFVCVPLASEGRAIGLLYLDAKEPDTFDDGIGELISDAESTQRLGVAVDKALTYMRERAPEVAVSG
jgi:GAF domain-containing protein